MIATGIIRRIDDLGRVVIPREVRTQLGVREGDAFEILVTEDLTGVLLQKYSFDTPVKQALKTLRTVTEKTDLSCREEFLRRLEELDALLTLDDAEQEKK